MTLLLLLLLTSLPLSVVSLACNACANGNVALCAPRGNEAWATRECALQRCFADPVTGLSGICRSPQSRALAQWATHEDGAPVSWQNRTLPDACDADSAHAVRVVLSNSVSHSKDLVFGGFDFGAVAPLPPANLLVSLRVNVTVRADAASNDDIQCRIRTIVLKDSDGGHTSSSRDDESLAFPAAATALVYGDKYDLWEDYVVASQLVADGGVRVHIDVEAFSKRRARLQGNVTCVVACVELVVDHIVAPRDAADGWSDYTDDETPFFDNATGAGTLFTLLDDTSAVKWRYNKAVPTDHTWKHVDFDDSAWKQAFGEFSANRGGTSIGKDAASGFFRHSFVLPNNDDPTKCYRLLRLQSSFRSGGRVWLNGHLLWQRNMPPTVAADPNTDFAIRKSDPVFLTAHINEPVLLRRAPAANVLAIEVHDESAEDTRLLMDFALEAVTTCTVPPPPRTTRTRTPRPSETDGTRRTTTAPSTPIASTTPSTAVSDDDTVPIVVANDGAPPLTGVAIGALVFAILFCAAGVVMWYLARKRQAVMKI
jgi:hypothetical protein